MKRAGGLWPEVASFEGLLRAAYRALRGKRGRPDEAEFFRDLEANLLALRDELEGGAYRPGAYRTFEVREPKRRMISVAPFRDRVVHHALVAAVEPVFEPRFIHDSYACRAGKGQHRALARFVAWGRTTRYVLVGDVARFFPSVDHAILKGLLARAVKDERVLALCATVIDASNPQGGPGFLFPGDDLFTPFARRRGLPIGNLTSQFFANVVLDALDHFVKERLRARRYVRYCDDFAIFGDEREALGDARAAIEQWLWGLRLRLNQRRSRVRRLREGVEFLGFVVRPDRLRVRRTTVARLRRRLGRLSQSVASGNIDLARAGASIRASVAHLRQGGCASLARTLLQGRRWSPPGRATASAMRTA